MGGVRGWHSVPFRTSYSANDSPLGYICNYIQLIMKTKLEVLSTSFYNASLTHSLNNNIKAQQSHKEDNEKFLYNFCTVCTDNRLHVHLQSPPKINSDIKNQILHSRKEPESFLMSWESLRWSRSFSPSMEHRTSLLGLRSQEPATANCPDMSPIYRASVHSLGQNKFSEMAIRGFTKLWRYYMALFATESLLPSLP